MLTDEQPCCLPCYEANFTHDCQSCGKRIGLECKDMSYKDMHWHEVRVVQFYLKMRSINRTPISLPGLLLLSEMQDVLGGEAIRRQEHVHLLRHLL